MIRIKRIYEDPSPDDGSRILVDRLWPRGLGKEKAGVDLWLKDVAPSEDLRKLFHHDVQKWTEFKERYFAELDQKEDIVNQIRHGAGQNVTLLYGARDEEHNNAVALREYIMMKTRRRGSRGSSQRARSEGE